MKPITRFFTSIGNFLNASVNYVETRVKNGLFVQDIRSIHAQWKSTLNSSWKKLSQTVIHSSQFKLFSSKIKEFWQKLMMIPLFENIYTLTKDAIGTFITHYAILFLTFTFTFPTLVLLMNFFDTNVFFFFIGLIPIVFWNIYCLSALYQCMQRRDKGEHIQLWTSYADVLKQLPAISLVSFTQMAIVIEVLVLYVILALFFGYFFDAMGLPSGDSFIYWFGTIFVGLLLLIGIFIFTIILHETYFVCVLEERKVREAFTGAIVAIKRFATPIVVLYLLLYLFMSIIIYWATLTYLYIGFALSIYLLLHLSLFTGFLLRRKFFTRIPMHDNEAKTNPKPVFIIIIVFGLINYLLSASVITNQFQYITSTIERYRDNYFLSKDLKMYTNSVYRFMIQYPQNWTEYEWRGSSVTFYNNYTGTVVGGIWLNVSVSSYNEEAFIKLYEARPGLVSLNNQTGEVTTKVSNISVQGYPGVHYTFYLPEEPYPQYQTHYLIRKDQFVYKISFSTLDKDVEGNNTDLYEKIVGSFRFIE